jgi:alpha-tubulin suppressor-like RCC1 family protein
LGSIAAVSALWIGLFAVSAPQTARAVTLATGITAGGAHTCAVTDTGSAKCWGWNYYGQLGVGTDEGPQVCALAADEYPIACSTVPVTVSGLSSGIKAIDAGYAHTCALTTTGGVKCWGYNAGGQLGNGTDSGPDECGQFPVPCSLTPVAVNGLDSGVTAIAVGWNHGCALMSTGGIECWGANSFGQLGDGTTTDRSSPVAVELPDGVTATAIAAGGHHTCAVTSTGGIECWGMNRFGQLGNGTDTGPQKCGEDEDPCSKTPVSVQLPDGVTATSIAIGDESTCALDSAGGVQCWGFNDAGQLGDGTTTDSTIPVTVQLPGGVTATAIYGSAYHFCAVTSGGGVECWGYDISGLLGDGTTNDSSIPVTVSGLASGATAIAAGDTHTCAMTDIGGVECWGDNHLGSLGTGDKQFHRTPTPVKGLSGARTLSVSVDGAGSGAITSSPSGINCGAGHTSCSASFEASSTIQLHASAEPGSAFSKFSGEGCGKGGSACAVTMGSDRSASATFALPPTALIAAPAGGRTYALGETVPTSFSCTENASGPGLLSCNDSNSVKTASGGAGKLNTSTVGFHAYTVTAVSRDRLAGSASIGYRVVSPSMPEPPEPEPPTPSASSIAIRSGSALIAQGRTKVRLSCTGGTAASVCRGRLSLVSRTPLGRRFRLTSYKGTVLANARYAIPTGESRFVGLRLRKALLPLMERAGRLELRATAIATEESARAASRAVVLRLAKR